MSVNGLGVKGAGEGGLLDAVVNQVGKIAQRAHGHAAPLVSCATVGVRARHMRHDDVDVGAGTHRARLQERLLIKDAQGVDVQPRLHVIEGVAHEVEAVPKGFVKDVLRLRRDQVLRTGGWACVSAGAHK